MSLLGLAGRQRGLLLLASVSLASLVALRILVSRARSGIEAPQTSGRRRRSKKSRRKIYLRGLYNLGNTCFLNSTLQSLSALDAVGAYVDCCAVAPSGDASPVDVAIAAQLQHVLGLLGPQPRPVAAYSPRALLSSLGNKSRWVANRGEQDAQELFQVLSSTLQALSRGPEASLFSLDVLASTGSAVGGVVSTLRQPGSSGTPERRSGSHRSFSDGSPAPNGSCAENPFLGMAASRTACVLCGYTAAIRHFTFDNLSLSVPRKRSTTIEECLALYTVIDQLDDFKCRRCSISATLAQTKADADRCKAAPSQSASRPKKAAAAVAESLLEQQQRLERALANDPEADLESICLVAPPPGKSTRQTMVARTPRILVLHLSRSIFLPTGGVAKNPARVQLQRFLDLSPFATTGHISTSASQPISGPSVPVDMRSAKSLAAARSRNCLYRLCAVVFHLGAHDS
ncbi:ubiquitin-specific protease ubp1, partial [Coemansia nantahalensis]